MKAASRMFFCCLGFSLVIGGLTADAQQPTLEPTLQRLFQLLNGYKNRYDIAKNSYKTWEYTADYWGNDANEPPKCAIGITVDQRDWVKKNWTGQVYDDATIVLGAVQLTKSFLDADHTWQIGISSAGKTGYYALHEGVTNDHSFTYPANVGGNREYQRDSVILTGLDQNTADQVFQLLTTADQICRVLRK